MSDASAGLLPLIAADEFRELLRTFAQGPLEPLEIAGPVDLAGLEFERPIDLANIVFRDRVVLSGAHFRAGLTLSGCTFRRGADLTGLKVGGGLTISQITSALHRFHEGPVWQMDAGVISGDLVVQECRFEGDSLRSAFSANRIRVEGSMKLDRLTVTTVAGPQEHNQPTELRINEAAIAGNLQIGQYPWNETGSFELLGKRANRIDADVAIVGASVNGSLNVELSLFARDVVFAGSSFRHVHAVACHFAADLNFFGTVCSGIFRTPHHLRPTDLEASGWEPGGVFVGGGLELSGARILSQLDLASLVCRGTVNMIGAEIGSFLISSRLYDHSEIASLNVVDTTFRSYVHIGSARFGPAPSQTGTTVAIASSSFGNSLLFWSGERRSDIGVTARKPTGWLRPESGDWADYLRCRVTGDVAIRDCAITGEFDLTSMLIEPGPDGRAGGLDLTRTRVSGHLRFRSPLSELDDLEAPQGQRDAARSFAETADAESAGVVRARAAYLDMSGLQAAHVDLSGLSVVEPEAMPDGDQIETVRDPRIGHVFARDAVITQDFRLFQTARLNAAERTECASTTIPRSLRLDGAQIDTLVIAADTFDDHESTDPEMDGITFNDARIGTLHVPRRQGLARNGFPVPVQLTGLTVQNWDFGTFGENRSLSPALQVHLANAHLDFMDNDVGLNRDVYRSIHRSLRNRGHDKAAIAIHVAEHYRAQWEPRGKWRPGEARMRVWFGRDRAPLADNLRGLGRSGAAALRQLARANPLRLPYDLFVRKYLHYGASVLPLGWLIVGLLILSWQLIAHVPQNMKLSEEALRLIIADRTAAGDGRPMTDNIAYRRTSDAPARFLPCADWSQGDAAWTALRYHVPVVSIFARDEFVPDDSQPLVLALPAWASDLLRRPQAGPAPAEACAADPASDRQVRTVLATVPFASAEDWFQFMSLLNWIMWPLLLTFLVRRIVRD